MPSSRHCTAIRLDGQPCQAWARPHSDPPLCSSHDGWKHTQPALPLRNFEPDNAVIKIDPSQTLYSRSFSGEELVALLATLVDHSLNGEVMAARVAVRRILEQLEKELSPTEYARLAALIFTGTNTIAGLLRAQRTLSGDVADELRKLLGRALDQMAKEEKVPL